MDNILEALKHLPAAELDYSDWLKVGMALKTEGCDCAVWDEWSRADAARWHPGECQRKWESFRRRGKPVTGRTIMMMARKRGWRPPALSSPKPEETAGVPGDLSPAQELALYLSTLFRPEERVCYVMQSHPGADGKWHPAGSGCCDRSAGELAEGLKHCGGDLGAVMGDWNREAGAWIRFNPVDGLGGKDRNVTAFRHALVESDSMSPARQEQLLRQLKLPIACLVSSGGKSIHAIVKIGAKDPEEYRQRVDFLYRQLEQEGMSVDRQNSNPSRLSRMPGVTRQGRRQRLLGVDLGCGSWEEWVRMREDDREDGLPPVNTMDRRMLQDPRPPEELIRGVLRRGHKMMIAGSSKAGKSFLLMELCIALSEGREWLGFACRKSRVLYVNLEIDPASCYQRFRAIYRALGMTPAHPEDLGIWDLRGQAVPLDRLVPGLVRRLRQGGYEAVVVDPIYKVITGDENSAGEMAAFCNLFDRICRETGCSVIFCHHHSKGAQGAKKVIDRASGSGVFARDPDAQLDMIALELTEEQKLRLQESSGATPWKLECSLREFPNFRPVYFWFDYPLHRLDRSGELASAQPEGVMRTDPVRSPRRTAEAERRALLDTAWEALYMGDPVKIAELAEYMEVSTQTVRRYLTERPEDYWCSGGLAGRRPEREDPGKEGRA